MAHQRSDFGLLEVLAICLVGSSLLLCGLGLSKCAAQEPGAERGLNDVNDELAPKATWQAPTDEEVKAKVQKWLKEVKASKLQAKNASEYLSMRLVKRGPSELIDTVVGLQMLLRPDVGQFVEDLRNSKGVRPPKLSSILDNPEESEFLRDHVRLYYGRWLAQNKFYDEALMELNKVKLGKVLDGGTLLFYRGLMEHQLLQKDACLKTVNQLLENSDSLPRRYNVLANLMLADIKPLEKDSLDEISRLMADIRRRTKLSRSGKIVLKQEKDVIDKLDKLIEQLEAQQQAQQSSSSNAPSTPMEDSRKVAGKGSGKVTNKRQADGGDWGDLPPAERAAALAEMAKDMPPHYRAVIEEYFKKLAEQDQ